MANTRDLRAWLDQVRELGELKEVSGVSADLEIGPLMDRVQEGPAVDLCSFPAPQWHEEDGGRYIGTGCLVVMRDPDSGWVNTGAYRVQVHDQRTAGIMITRGRNGDVIMRKRYCRADVP